MKQQPLTQSALTIVALDVQNVQRIRAVHIVPKGSTVILGGRNAQGKTSILDAIEMALGGGRALSERPVRDGARQAQIIVDLGELVVERTITKTGTELVVRDRDGVKQRSPQAILNDLCSKIAFDPLAFAREEPEKQNELLRRLVGIDFTDSNRQREALYNSRTKVSRDAKSLRAQSEGMLVPADTPEKPVDVTRLLAQLREAHASQLAAREHTQGIMAAERQVTETEAAVEAAKKALKAAELRAASARLQRAELGNIPAPTVVDAGAIERQVQNAQAINRNVDKRLRRDELELEANHLEAQAGELSHGIEQIDSDQQQQLASVRYPVDGLSLGDSGPLFKGVPLAQASAAERLRVSVGIGLALNPRLRVLLVRDASLLDDESLALVADMAAAAGAQVWLERVGTGDPTAVIISDGQVLNGKAAELLHEERA